MPKPTFDLQDDERLSIEVHKYKCLYDKTSKGYKEKDRVINAWNAVEVALELAEGKAYKLTAKNTIYNISVLVFSSFVKIFKTDEIIKLFLNFFF